MNPFFNIEKDICEMFEKKTGLFTRNGTTALWALLKALGFTGEKFVVPTNICFVVPLAIILSDNVPYFVDMDENFTINPNDLEDIDSGDVKGVIFPYMYGNTGQIEEVVKICERKNWILVEDTAQSLGAKIGRRYVGSFSDFSMTSFGMGKIIDINIGGVLCLNSSQLRDEVLKIYNGLPALNNEMLSRRKYFSQLYLSMVDCIEGGEELYKFGIPLTYTYRECFLSQIGSDISFLHVLEKRIGSLQEESDIRYKNAGYFQTLLDHEDIVPISHREGATYWRQNILVKKDREGLLKYLKENKVKVSKYFPSIDKFFYPRNGKDFNRSDSMTKQVINLWPGRQTSYDDVVRINELIHRFYSRL